jgi:hypothetical protein
MEHDRNRLTVTLAPVAMLDPEGVQPLKRGFESGTLKAVEFAVVYLAAGGNEMAEAGHSRFRHQRL